MAGDPEPADPGPADVFPVSGTARAEWSADLAVVELYSQHYRALVRLAALLVRDTGTAEEVVQDSFVAMHGGWQRLRDAEKALAYLRQAVVNRSRLVLRHRTVVDKNLQKAPPDMPSAEHGARPCSNATPLSPPCATCPTASARPSCCATTPTCPRPTSPPPWGSAGARSRATPPAAFPPCARPWRSRAPDAGLGPDGTQVGWHGFAEYLRRALHAFADQIEPQADGLAPIRARIPAGSGIGDRRPRGTAGPGRGYRGTPGAQTRRP